MKTRYSGTLLWLSVVIYLIALVVRGDVGPYIAHGAVVVGLVAVGLRIREN